ncbi:MAG: RimJ/RimL family protein N-acetyltransferase [Candidatus Promineifilaceae bacterium]|jgi:RimJ/RimL family protein N-acetyltransferase
MSPITLVRTNPVELSNFVSLEQHLEAADFVIPNSLKEHLKTFFDPSIIYLTIEKKEDKQPAAGFMILTLDPDQKSIELRRIVVANKDGGVGQQAMGLLEKYVKQELGRSRIWLDVFTNNQRALHIYRKMGYSQYGTADYVDGRPLLLFEKEF